MEWFVKVGDKVNEMDKLCLVESDKASVEITSRYSGVVKSILVPAFEQAKVGTVIVEIEDGKVAERIPELDQPANEIQAGKPKSGTPATERTGPVGGGSEIRASPPVRGLAKSLGVDLSKISGTGKDGRITEEDVRKGIKQEERGHKEDIKIRESMEVFGPSKEVRMTQVGQAMVKMMNASLKVPQLTHSDEIDCDQLLEIVKELKPIAKSEFGLPALTLTAFFIKAVSLGMQEYPIINSRFDTEGGSSYYLLENHNVSVAMDSPRGLVVPNIKNVEKLTLVEIQKCLIELHDRAKSGRLSFEDIKGGTVSLSNIGVIGGTYTKPVIFDGQSVIGAVGKIMKVPKFNELNAIVPKKIFNVSWTADHRHVDGATVARFSNQFKFWLENPSELIALHFK